jgi:hypothetical protein
MTDNRPTWKPFSEYLERWGERKRAEGNPSPDIAPQSFWDEWRKNNQMPVDKKAA